MQHGVLEIWEHRELQILTSSGDFMGFPNGFLVVLVKPMGKPGSFRNTDWWHQIAVRCSHEVPDDCPGGPVIHLGGAPWRSFDLEPVPQCPSGPVPGIFDS